MTCVHGAEELLVLRNTEPFQNLPGFLDGPVHPLPVQGRHGFSDMTSVSGSFFLICQLDHDAGHIGHGHAPFPVKEEAQELRKLSEEEHEKVITLSEKAQAAHEEMLTYFRKTDDIRTAADDAHKKFIEARNNASAKHEEFKAVLSDIHVINKKLGSGKPRKRKS